MQRVPSHSPSRPKSPLVVDLTGEDQQEGDEFEGLEDGPLIRHPREITKLHHRQPQGLESASISKEDHRLAYRRHLAHLIPLARNAPVRLIQVIQMPRSVDMTMLAESSNDEIIADEVERWYIHAELYLHPGRHATPGQLNSYKREWDMNAQGIYYRHHYSPHWADQVHKMWIPSLDGLDWNNPGEATRRQRAKLFVKHALDNEKWNKSEYAWDADAWTDVFGQMRDDPVLAADKRTYYTSKKGHYPVSCLFDGTSDWVYRTPDATFGLATFKPKDYQNALAFYELDHDRLQALMLNSECEIVSDPQLGNSDLVFPFAVYEAKGWSGDARDARHQACSAAAVYLDMLHDLGRWPIQNEVLPGFKQQIYLPTGKKAQIFVFTSFGAHWHILVGYRRQRNEKEHAGTKGLSENVYIFQRLWSARVVTEQKAWELLSLVDQIHEWGVTEHRDLVISHLEEWHEYCSISYARRAQALSNLPGFYQGRNERILWMIPKWAELSWAKHLPSAKRAQLQSMVLAYVVDAYMERFGPYPAGHYRFLLDFRDSCRRNGKQVEFFSRSPDGLEPQEDELNGDAARSAGKEEDVSSEPLQKCLKLPIGEARSAPTRLQSRVKRPRDEAGKVNKRRKKQKDYPID